MAALAVLLAALAMTSIQDPEPGISRDLARARRERIARPVYALTFDLEPDAESVSGSLELKFDLAEDDPLKDPLVLDFGGERLEELRVNGRLLGAGARQVADHVLIPADALGQGGNLLEARFVARIAATGAALTRYRDPADGREYLYTLLVPADAHRLFPCFDQPDLKGRFELRLRVPGDWTAVANAASDNEPALHQFADEPRVQPDGRRLFRFATTEPLPTYLFAFAAGPFAIVEDTRAAGIGRDPNRGIRILLRPAQVQHLDRDLLFRMHRDGLRRLGVWFDLPYPFDKLDIVLLPGFPYGGMEHAGAIFYRETALSFEREPTASEQLRRSALIYHEIAHQWFGNLVTMEWFDDLWLKEGFATFLGYTLVEELEPGRNAWLRFHQRVKPSAYAVDATEGTTPIFQELTNLADAKSAYGAIVYNKAPAVLRELEARLGKEPFRRGARLFVRRHAFGNATFGDLLDAMTAAGGLRGSRWSDRWILGRGLPQVSVDWSRGEDGKIAGFAIEQRAVGTGDEGATWPLSVDLLLLDADGSSRSRELRIDAARTELPDLVGSPAPAAVLLNPRDVAYGLFSLDPLSRDHLVDAAISLSDPLVRAVAVSALEECTRDGNLDPRRFGATLLGLIEAEQDPDTHDWLLGKLGLVLGRWLPPSAAAELRGQAEELLTAQLRSARTAGTAVQTFRFLARNGRGPAIRELLRGVLDGSTVIEGLALEARDRFLAAAALLAAGDLEAVERERARSAAAADIGKWTYLAGAAGSDGAVKERWFASYRQLEEPPEQWMQDSLDYFHWPGQEELTLPFLRRALEMVGWVKEHRKIFFMPAWIDGFVNGHASAEALAIVEGFLAERRDLPADVRRKILQSVDALRRAVRIRETWG
jgi:aminopeptidase N